MSRWVRFGSKADIDRGSITRRLNVREWMRAKHEELPNRRPGEDNRAGGPNLASLIEIHG